MKKTLNIMLSLLILFSFSLHVSSQTDQKDLDQVKLMKQFLGTWKSETGPDSIAIMEVVPAGEGLYFQLENKTKGEIYSSARAVVGFTDQNESVAWYTLFHNGFVMEDFGKFVSEKKLVLERFVPDLPNHAVAITEVEFISPDTHIWFAKARGKNITWEPLWELKTTFTKVKE